VPSSATGSRRSAAAALLPLSIALLACGGEEERPPAEPPPVAVVAEPVLHDLAADFPAAELHRQKERLDLGTAEARSHLLAGWGADESDGDGPFVWGVGERSELEFFAGGPAEVTLVVRGRALRFEGAPEQRVRVAVNGREVGEVVVPKRLGERRLPLPRGALEPGRNVVTFTYGYHREPAEVIPGARDERSLAVQWYGVELRGLADAPPPRLAGAGELAAPERIEIPLGSEVGYYFELGPGAELAFDDLAALEGDLARLRVRVETGSGTELHLHDPAGPEVAGPLRIPLGLEARGVVHLALGATREGLEGGVAAWLQGLFAEPGGVSVVRPRVVSAAPSIEAAADVDGSRDEEGGTIPDEEGGTRDEEGGTPRPSTPRPNVLIYLVDTLRADHLGLYGYPRPTSPRIDAFGADATVFRDAQAQTSWTRTAVASILTGLLPQSHGVRDRADALAPPVATLAEILAAAGYRTAGIITNGNVEPAFGTGQGFELYDYLSESKERVEFHQLSDRLNEAAFAWLESWRATPAPDRAPFFLYLHATDPHAPYTPPEPFRSRFAPGVDPERGHLDRVHAISAGSEPAPPGTAEAWRQLYDGEVAWNDHHFGELLDRLKALDLYDSTLIVLISDHGEEFYEHGGWEHGKTLYAEQLRIPLVIRLPGGGGAGREVADLADQIDVLPTILDHLGIEPPAPVDGRSLLPLLRGNSAGTRPAEPSFAELRLDVKEIESAVAGGWKLILDDSEYQRAGPVELFHVADDPGETRNLHPHHPLEEGFLAQQLRALGIRRPEPAFNADTAEIDEELKGRLEALGYLD